MASKAPASIIACLLSPSGAPRSGRGMGARRRTVREAIIELSSHCFVAMILSCSACESRRHRWLISTARRGGRGTSVLFVRRTGPRRIRRRPVAGRALRPCPLRARGPVRGGASGWRRPRRTEQTGRALRASPLEDRALRRNRVNRCDLMAVSAEREWTCPSPSRSLGHVKASDPVARARNRRTHARQDRRTSQGHVTMSRWLPTWSISVRSRRPVS